MTQEGTRERERGWFGAGGGWGREGERDRAEPGRREEKKTVGSKKERERKEVEENKEDRRRGIFSRIYV
jgi:hypothetical protein